MRAKTAVAGGVHVAIGLAWAVLALPRHLEYWLVGTVAVAGYFLVFIARHAGHNAPTGASAPSARLGPGTVVTLARISCLSLLSGYLLSPPTPSHLWLLAGLYGAIGIGDWLDGFLARRARYETVLGAQLDLRVDILGMLIAPLVAVGAGRLPAWYLVLSIAPVLFHGDLARRRAGGHPCYDERLPHSAHTRAFAGFQMALIAVAFVPLFDAAVVWVVATTFMMPPLVAFVRDWCVATGRLVPGTASYDRLIARTLVAARRVAPALLRLLFASGVL